MARTSKTASIQRRHYGWHPDRPDHRDVLFAASPASQGTLPAKVDLRRACPPIFNQGELGSCTANAISAAYRFDLLKQKIDAGFVPSRLFIYYNERAMEGTIKSDGGAAIRDGIKSIAKQGVCSEAKLPYDVAKFAAKPSAACFAEAKAHTALSYQRVPQSISQMKACLAAGYPFVFGFTVYESFESAAVAKSGVLNLPAQSEKTVGGHALLAVGYDDVAQRITVQNSWGDGWGQKGYFTMPYAYINDSDLAEDFWTVRVVG